ncbi:hypothetical protein BJV82DRAFT_318048 [Fennellomyces sp. T-0311]|nr:hypothetical protein BJV82DRAFT_318048 [Fennellomyces sp. T-0311]
MLHQIQLICLPIPLDTTSCPAAQVATEDSPGARVTRDDDGDGRDVELDNEHPYHQSPGIDLGNQRVASLALDDEIDEFFNPIADSVLRLPPGFDLGPVPEEPLMVGSVNVASRFHTYKHKALQAACSGNGLPVETQTHEIAVLSQVLTLKRRQYSNMVTDIIGKEVLDSLHSKYCADALKYDIKLPSATLLEISTIIDQLAQPDLKKHPPRLAIMSQLLVIACKESYSVSHVILGLSLLLSRIPNMSIANVNCISESELWSCFYDPILSAVLADPDQDVLLR